MDTTTTAIATTDDQGAYCVFDCDRVYIAAGDKITIHNDGYYVTLAHADCGPTE